MDYDERRRDRFNRGNDANYQRSSLNRGGDRGDHNEWNHDKYYENYNKSAARERDRSRSRSRSRERSSESYGFRGHQDQRPQKRHEAFVNYGHQSQQEPVRRSHTNSHTPSKNIMLRNLLFEMTDDELSTELNMLTVPYRHIRLVKNREATHLNRGFAFIEFNTLDEAQRWMTHTQGSLMFSNSDVRVQLFYSHMDDQPPRQQQYQQQQPYKRDYDSNNDANSSEWDCAKCGVRNFKRRDKCFKCGITKEESEARRGGDGYDHVGSTPCNTIILRGLDALTTSDRVREAIDAKSNKIIVIKNCHVTRDPVTNLSNGFAFVEMNSITDAGYMLQILQPAFEIDGKLVTINYSKNTFTTAITQNEKPQTQSHSLPQSQTFNQTDRFSSSSYPKNGNGHGGGYNNYSPRPPNNSTQLDQTNSAAALAQAAMRNMMKKNEIINHLASNMANSTTPILAGNTLISSEIESSIAADEKNSAAHTAPDVTKFVYDETSGYYYDYATGFYYDATSQYFYNSATQKYCYWDAVSSSYIPVENTPATPTAKKDGDSTAATSSTSTPEPQSSASVPEKAVDTKTTGPQKGAKTSQPVKSAAQIAKDMEEWAKSMNKKKVPGTPVAVTTTPVETKTVVASAATASLEAREAELKSYSSASASPVEFSFAKKHQPQEAVQSKPEVVTYEQTTSKNYTSPVMSKEKPIVVTSNSNDEIIDLVKMACLLCKRKFDSVEILNKHVAKSDLHKTNLEKLRNESRVAHEENSNSSLTQSENSMSVEDSLQAALKFKAKAEKELKIKVVDRVERPISPTDYAASSSSSRHKSSKRDGRSKRDRGGRDEDIYGNNDDSFNSSAISEPSGAPSDSFASKMMKKMGWNEGSGIGKNLQGISAPIQATMRQKGSGLGASAAYELDPNDLNYHDAAKLSAKMRFEHLMNQS